MKSGARYIAIASGPIAKRRTILVGVIFRENYIEGLLSSTIQVDGTDSTARIIRMVERSRFKDQVRMLLFNGIALAGLNLIDPSALERRLKSRVIVLTRRRQRPKELIKALREFSRLSGREVSGRIALVNGYAKNKPLKTGDIFLQSTLEAHYLKKFAPSALEALRIAHIIASGISKGESKGRV